MISLAAFACAWMGLAAPHAACAASVPSSVKSLTIDFFADKATYNDDLGHDVVEVPKKDIESGQWVYKKTGNNSFDLKYTNVKYGGEMYSGTYHLTFKTATTGTWSEEFTGTYDGTRSGTFEVVTIDVPGAPKAVGKKLKVDDGDKVRFKLKGKSKDIGETKLKYKILKKPKVGRLDTKKLPKVVYKAPEGFKGTVKLKFLVKEGKTKSKPATVKIKVR